MIYLLWILICILMYVSRALYLESKFLEKNIGADLYIVFAIWFDLASLILLIIVIQQPIHEMYQEIIIDLTRKLVIK